MKINPSVAKGLMTAPPSKSMAHRNLICAALAQGKSIISNIDFSADIEATFSCLNVLGVKVQLDETNKTADSSQNASSLTVYGTGGHFTENPHSLFCNESGSTLRFFIPLALLSKEEAIFTGSRTLLSRPLSVYEELCKNQGIIFQRLDTNTISQNTKQEESKLRIQGKLQPGNFTIPGNISSQFITGLLFALPLLSSDSTITLIDTIESRAYIDMTIQTQKSFGIEIIWKNENTLFIKGNQKYIAKNQTVEGDFSNAAFFEAFNTIDGNVKIDGLNDESLQGDKIYLQHFSALEKDFCTIDISDCPDLGPILFVVAALHKGGKFTGTKRLKIKESDRGSVMCQELAKLGITSKQSENEIEIWPLQEKDLQSLQKAQPVTLLGHNDHRIVMALSVLLTKVGGNLEGVEAVRKSLPDFFKRIKKLGIDFELNGEEIKNGLDY